MSDLTLPHTAMPQPKLCNRFMLSYFSLSMESSIQSNQSLREKKQNLFWTIIQIENIHPSTCTNIHPSIATHAPTQLPTNPSIHPATHPSTCSPTHTPIYPSISHSIHCQTESDRQKAKHRYSSSNNSTRRQKPYAIKLEIRSKNACKMPAQFKLSFCMLHKEHLSVSKTFQNKNPTTMSILFNSKGLFGEDPL